MIIKQIALDSILALTVTTTLRPLAKKYLEGATSNKELMKLRSEALLELLIETLVSNSMEYGSTGIKSDVDPAPLLVISGQIRYVRKTWKLEQSFSRRG